MTATIPLPVATSISRPYWDACREERLTFQRCRQCRAAIFIPLPRCNRCFSDEIDWEASTGRGIVYSWSTVWRPQQAGFSPGYVAAIVELDEGWHMLTNVVDCPLSDVHIGMRVQVLFRKVSPEITLPYFQPEREEGKGGGK